MKPIYLFLAAVLALAAAAGCRKDAADADPCQQGFTSLAEDHAPVQLPVDGLNLHSPRLLGNTVWYQSGPTQELIGVRLADRSVVTVPTPACR